MTAEVRIEVDDLERTFGETRAVRGVSLSVNRGEIYGLVGPDGAGKTTTLRMVAGLLEPSKGRVRLMGKDPFGRDTSFREELGYMPQQYALYGDLSIDENLAFFRDMFALSRDAFEARRKRLLAMTRLEPFGHRRADALSGGMYKKLALSCALLHEPKVLLLDEPTNGVDPVSRREFWDLLHEFLEEGMAIILATPYMDEAARCHRAGLLFEGSLLEEGRPGDLLAAFPHRVFHVRSESEKRNLEGIVEKNADVLAFTPGGTQLRVVVRKGGEENVLSLLEQAGLQATPAVPSFEDLFLAKASERSETRR